MIRQIIKSNILYIPTAIFVEAGITKNAYKSIFKRHRRSTIKDGKNILISYDVIPDDTKTKLPSKSGLISEYHLLQHENKVDEHYEGIYCAFHKGYIQHIEPLKEQHLTLPRTKIVAAAKRLAVWKYINESGSYNTLALYNAYNRIYKGDCKSYNVFANKKSKAKNDGFEAMAIDQRWFTTPKNVKQINVVNQFWASALISIGKKYSNRKVWLKLCELCNQSNQTPPSKGWVDKYRTKVLKSNIAIYESRNGKKAANDKQLTFATMKHAEFANDQFQYDGWQLPFYVGKELNRYTIIIVRDSCSKKIVGSAVGLTENTTIIMSALKDAITNTGCVPYEIVTDKHSWHKTGEAENFIKEIQALGTQYTVTTSPTHKAIVERYNRHLDDLCKDYYGYRGEGIKSRNVDARPKQELLDEYMKNPLSVDEVKLIGIKIVEDFNNTILPKYGKSPNQLFEESQKPNCFFIDVFARVKLLTAKTSLKICRGQIKIQRGLDIYEYQLPAEMQNRLNNRTVAVRYEDLNEGVYVYDEQTDEAIIELIPKPIIHGAKANQTEADIEMLNKNKGRITGTKVKAKKKNEELLRAALELNPQVVEDLNKATIPKNIFEEFESRKDLKYLAESKGIDTTKINVKLHKCEIENKTFLIKEVFVNENPFESKENAEITSYKRKPFKDKD